MIGQAVQLHRKLGNVSRAKPVPRPMFPMMIEAEFTKAIVGVVHASKASVLSTLRSLPSSMQRAMEVMDQAQISISSSEVTKLSTKFGQRVAMYTKEQLNRQVELSLGVGLFQSDVGIGSLIDSFSAECLAHIRAVPSKFHSDLGKLITRGSQDLLAEVERKFLSAESSAYVIARDQVGRLYGRMNARRHQNLGVTRFKWRVNRGDPNVRPEHQKLEGRVFAFDALPTVGLPGHDVLCHCSGEPVFTDILDEV